MNIPTGTEQYVYSHKYILTITKYKKLIFITYTKIRTYVDMYLLNIIVFINCFST